MTRKDYVRLAGAMAQANTRSGTSEDQHRIYVEELAEILYRDNDRFDYKRFYEACGVSYD
jgi:hypothetical protein